MSTMGGLRKRVKLSNDVVTREDIEYRLKDTIERCNAFPGPRVEWDTQRGCYGLRSDKDYKEGQRVTSYSGVKTVKRVDGDYVAKSGEVYINGHHGFKPSQKGRWINESDRTRQVVNVCLARVVRATRDLKAGEWMFADYGPEYTRFY